MAGAVRRGGRGASWRARWFLAGEVACSGHGGFWRAAREDAGFRAPAAEGERWKDRGKRQGSRFLRFLRAMVSLFPRHDRFCVDIVIRSAQD
jgi:hypothetical protein